MLGVASKQLSEHPVDNFLPTLYHVLLSSHGGPSVSLSVIEMPLSVNCKPGRKRAFHVAKASL